MTDRDNSHTPEDQAFVDKAAAAFQGSVNALDEKSRRDLSAARRAALAAAREQTAPTGQRWALIPLAGAAAAAVVLGWNLIAPKTAENIMPGGAVVTEFELLMETDDLALFEDLEFFAWLGSLDGQGVGEH